MATLVMVKLVVRATLMQARGRSQERSVDLSLQTSWLKLKLTGLSSGETMNNLSGSLVYLKILSEC